MSNQIRVDEDGMRIEVLRDAQKALAIAENAGDAKQYFLLWENYESLIRNIDGTHRNEELYSQGQRVVEDEIRLKDLCQSLQDRV